MKFMHVYKILKLEFLEINQVFYFFNTFKSSLNCLRSFVIS